MSEDAPARIRRLRASHGLSQARLADILGVSTTSVHRWERARTAPSALAWQRILQVENAQCELGRARRSEALPVPEEPHNRDLPAPLSSFVGRRRELTAIRNLLRRDDVRLVTLSGPGGSGKTRLALEAARGLLADYANGVHFVDLAPLAGPNLVLPSIAKALGLPDEPGRSMLDSLSAYLADQRLLLLLDNFEHVLPAALQVAALLRACPSLNALVTSRAVLGLSGEYRFAVPPLALPEAGQSSSGPEQAAVCEAVQLFSERARAAKGDRGISADQIEMIAAICRLLDGLPLAIELAAARTTVLSPRTLLDRLQRSGPASPLRLLTGGPRDAPARQRTLTAAIAWSYNLLDEPQQRLFRRLAVFAGGCTLEAAEWVSGNQAHLTNLTALVDSSLLNQEETAAGGQRFRMLETVRDFAWDRLLATDEAEPIRIRHAEWFLALAEEGETEFEAMASQDWLQRVDDELNNLRAAMAWCMESPARAEVGLRLAVGMYRYWDPRGSWAEGRAWLEQALGHGQGAPKPLIVKAWRCAGYLARLQEDYQAGLDYAERSLALARQERLGGDSAAALRQIARVALAQGDLAGAHATFEECLATARESGEWIQIALALSGLALVNNLQGDPAAARPRFEESLGLMQAHGLPFGTPLVRSGLASIVAAEGDLGRAEALFEQALALARRQGDRREVAQSLASLAALAARRSDDARARTLAEESLAICRQLKARLNASPALSLLALLSLRRGDHAGALTLYQERLSVRLGPDAARTLAQAVLRLAAMSSADAMAAVEHHVMAALLKLAEGDIARGQTRSALQLYSAAQVLRRMAGMPFRVELRRRLVRLADDLRAMLGEEQFNQAVQHGLAQPLAETLAEALTRIAGRDPGADQPAPPLRARPAALRPSHALTAREIEVIGLITAGMSNTEIAAGLVMSVRTVERHIGNIYGKLGIQGRSARAAVVAYAARHDLLPARGAAMA